MKNVARLIVANARDRNRLERDERVRAPGHQDRERDERDDPDRRSTIQATGSCHCVGLAADEPERQAADRERGDERAEPVELRRRVLVARLLDVAQRRPQRDGEDAAR